MSLEVELDNSVCLQDNRGPIWRVKGYKFGRPLVLEVEVSENSHLIHGHVLLLDSDVHTGSVFSAWLPTHLHIVHICVFYAINSRVMSYPECGPARVIVHVCLSHEIRWVAIGVGLASPGHGDEVSVDEGATHFENDHILVDAGLRAEGRLDDRLVLDLPVKIVDRLIDRVPQVVLREHREPAEVERPTHVEIRRHAHSIVARPV